jgi:hypothetical protein
MNTAKRSLNMIRAALIFAIAVYMYVGEQVAGGRAGPANAMLFQILAVVAVVNVVLTLIFRRSMVAPALATLNQKPGDAVALNRWRGGYIATYAMCEAIALYGFVLRVMGFSYRMVVPFYLASFIMMIYFAPRTARAQDAGPSAAPAS